MINDPVTLQAMKDTTVDLIESDHIDIVLVRAALTRTASGGVKHGVVANIASQTFFFGAITSDPYIIQGDNGEMIVARHVLVGLPTADIEEKDEFTIGSRHYKVIDTHPDASYERRAWVVERA